MQSLLCKCLPDWTRVCSGGQGERSVADCTGNALVLPLLAAGVGIGTVCVVGGQKIHKWVVEKKQERLITEQEAADAEEYLKKELSEVVDELQTNNGGNEE